ncbi:AraC family transcriptional regulator [Achromobacter sp. UMC46]|uniref:helix-turn-helix domain-containing protein n=1 Tax=Achromobacter sp. UMC46 TaxID=1862319 RepID=UPI0016025749|nr:AraC family transcriptional regulator [Achromobacter sp. UMC46]MBB1593295.1 AraC family transcriptional regulator [Achromobacter sp. UMC46]
MPARPSPPADLAPLPGADALGCAASKLALSQEYQGAGLTFYRKRTDNAQFGRVDMPASDRGFLVGVAMRPGHQRRISHGHWTSTHDFDPGAIYIRDFSDDYRADLLGGFDFVLVELSRAFIERINDEKGGPRISCLTPCAGQPDPVLAHLAQVLATVLERPSESSGLFVEHLGLAMGTHVLAQYGAGATSGWAESRGGRVLSRKLEARAKDMLLAALREDGSIADIATECGLSRSYFIKAFRQTVGTTPHRWLLEQRVLKAKEYLRTPGRSISEVAQLCGFADQSHMTRVFASVVGVSPGAWRRGDGG